MRVLAVAFGVLFFMAVSLVTGLFFDRIGWGYLLSSDVAEVAEARAAEPILGMPWAYYVAVLGPGIGVIAMMDWALLAWRFALGLGTSLFLLVTMWDMRRRRGTLAIYIGMRRREIGFEPRGDVIEVPKLMFVTMNEPGPAVWLILAVLTTLLAVALYPRTHLLAVLPLGLLAIVAVWVFMRQRQSPWEPLARRLRRASFKDGERLREYLEGSLDVDPEVQLLRHAADTMVARVLGGLGERD